jgi:DNA-directed RNA polymerase subunit delta
MTIHKSMLETAVEIIKRKRSPQKFDKIFKEVVEELKLSEEEAGLRVANFYNDLSLSGVFVYTGDNEWDLKDRQSVDLWDKDASFFIDPEELKARKAQRQAEKAALRAAVAEAQKASEIEQAEKAAKAEQLAADKAAEEEVEVEEVVADEPIEIVEEMMEEEDYNKYMDEYEDLYEEDK